MSIAEAELSPDEMLAEDLAGFYDDPLGFVLWAFPWGEGQLEGRDGPDDWQREYLIELGQEVADRAFDGVNAVDPILKSVSSGHGIGKSALTAWIILWIMSTRPFAKGIVTANTSEQLRTKTWAELGKWHKLCVCGHWFKYNSGRGSMSLAHHDFSESWRCDAQTCREENSESFAGLHAANSTPFYIFDEASAVPDKIYEVSEGGTTDGEPIKLLFGNPTRNTGYFHGTHHRFRHRWQTKQIDSRTVKITNKRRIAQWVEDYGEDSDFVRVRVRGVFPRAGSMQFISSEDVEKCKAMEDPPLDWSMPVAIGVDVARFGDDQSVIYVRRGRDARNFPIIKLRNADTMTLVGRIAEEIIRWKPEGVFIDGGGVGGGVIDRLRQMGYHVIEVQFGGSAKNPKRHFNKRTEIWDNMRQAIKSGLALPADDNEIEDDLTGIEYGYGGAESVLQLEKKKDMKERGLSSPDIGDALALTFAEVLPPRSRDGSDDLDNDDTGSDYNPFA